jgi:hypothetical protein
MKKILLPIFFFAVFLQSCSTDFETLAPYKEVMVVYGFVNPNDSIQFVRVSKAYLGEGNALIMAQQSDSINYADVLDVKMERTLNGSLINSYPLVRVDTIQRVPGTFNQNEVFYADTNQVMVDGSKYKIYLYNKSTGLSVSGITSVIADPGIDNPTASAINFSPPTGSNKIKYFAGSKAYMLETVYRFHYAEFDTVTGITVQKSFDWSFGKKLAPPSSTSAIQYTYQYSEFYNILAQNVPVDINKYRSFSSMELIITSITEEFNTYIGLTDPATGVVQDRPLYTNIENGIGIFTSRNIYSRKYSVSYNTTIAIDPALHFR